MYSAVLLAAVVLGTLASKEAPKKDGEIVGEWRVESLTVSAETKPPKSEPQFYIFDADGKYYVRQGETGKPTPRGTYVVDRKARPKSIDFEVSAPDRFKLKGIFKVDGDTLTLCFSPLPKEERPSAFESPKDSLNMLYVLKRVKKD